MFDPGPCVYMDKIACAADLADVVDPTAPIETTLANIAQARGVAVQELTACILDRPRHEADLVRRVRDPDQTTSQWKREQFDYLAAVQQRISGITESDLTEMAICHCQMKLTHMGANDFHEALMKYTGMSDIQADYLMNTASENMCQ